MPTPGPIVLITLEGLRPDVVGGLGGDPELAPTLSRLTRSPNWARTAIAPSSWLTPSFASLMTGLKPWQHQAITGTQPEMAGELVTLAEALQGLGYRTRGYHDSERLTAALGCLQGFDRVFALRRGQRATQDLASLKSGRDFVWIHLTLPAPPYVRRDYLMSRLGPVPRDLPHRLGGNALEQYFDPARPLPPAIKQQLWALYRLNVAAADVMLGRLLEGLAASGHQDDVTLAVVSLYGQEFGEHGQISSGGNLGRSEIEVPLILHLPRPLRDKLAIPEGEPVGIARLWATLLTVAGGTPPPGVAPSLFEPVPRGALSELYMAPASNEISWVEGDLQLRWIRRFADPGEDFFRLRLAALAVAKDMPPRLVYRERIGKLEQAFRQAPPLTGDVPPSLVLERWLAGGKVERVEDATRTTELASRLRHAWGLFVGEERTPAEEAARRWR